MNRGEHADLRLYEERYRADAGFERELTRARQRLALEVLAERRPAAVVEIGCGTDPFYRQALGLAAKPRSWVIVEPVDGFADEAERSASPEIGLEVIRGLFENRLGEVTGALDGSPGLTLCFGVLQSVSDPADWLRSVRATMRSGDALLLAVANAYSIHRRLARVMGLIDDEHELSERDRAAFHHHVFAAGDLRDLVGAAGFALADSGGYFLKPFTHGQMDRIRDVLTPELLSGLFTLGRELPELAAEIYVLAEAE